ncbi:hypothetical protein Syun_012650 [Stephania yunnanensis]|uniref:Uncharacterized protein n=1 Tax=Stephania yunnanensis TaxID=152371 RepID=A0AAP0K216_9MAGN
MPGGPSYTCRHLPTFKCASSIRNPHMNGDHNLEYSDSHLNFSFYISSSFSLHLLCFLGHQTVTLAPTTAPVLVDKGFSNLIDATMELHLFYRHPIIRSKAPVVKWFKEWLVVDAWGLKNCTQNEEWFSDTVTAMVIPSYIDSSKIVREAWKRYNLSLGLGLNKVAIKVFRIGHLGNLNEQSLPKGRIASNLQLVFEERIGILNDIEEEEMIDNSSSISSSLHNNDRKVDKDNNSSSSSNNNNDNKIMVNNCNQYLLKGHDRGGTHNDSSNHHLHNRHQIIINNKSIKRHRSPPDLIHHRHHHHKRGI